MTPVWDDAVADWVAALIPDCGRGFGDCRAVGFLDRRGAIAAGVVFHGWWPERGVIEISGAAVDRRWCTRSALAAIWGYAFAVARVAMGRTSELNAPVRRIWTACGAAEHVIPDLWGEGEAGVIHTLTAPQWRSSRMFGA